MGDYVDGVVVTVPDLNTRCPGSANGTLHDLRC